MMDLYAAVPGEDQAHLGKRDFVAFPSATGQGCAEKWFCNEQAGDFRNNFIIWDL